MPDKMKGVGAFIVAPLDARASFFVEFSSGSFILCFVVFGGPPKIAPLVAVLPFWHFSLGS